MQTIGDCADVFGGDVSSAAQIMDGGKQDDDDSRVFRQAIERWVGVLKM